MQDFTHQKPTTNLESQKEEIRNNTDIVEIIGERITLKKAGNNFQALCPFHQEKTASFFVNPILKRYRCFGCGNSGDVFQFLMQFENMSFYESLKYVAERLGIKLIHTQPTPQDRLKEKLLEIHNLAKEYYHYLLTKHPIGEEARIYLKERGINQQSVKIFQLGFAPNQWRGLFEYLTIKKHFSASELESAGLVIKKNRGQYYDRFRNRIIFPLKNHRGQVLGFSGRTLFTDTTTVKEAKYINSPETLIYQKSKLLFGLYELHQFIRKENQVILVEGELDVISSAQAEVNHVVAVKGSALSLEQIKLLEHIVDRIILAFDQDEAGIKASERAIELLKNKNLELRVIDYKQLSSTLAGKDPDEIARKSPSKWRRLSKHTISVYQFIIDATIKQEKIDQPEGKVRVISKLAQLISEIPMTVARNHYLNYLAEKLAIDVNDLQKDINAIYKKQLLKINKQQNSIIPSTLNNNNIVRDKTNKQKVYLEKLEQYLVFLLLNPNVSLPFTTLVNQIKDLKFNNKYLNLLLQLIKQYDLQTPDLATITKFAPEDLREQLMIWIQPQQYLEIEQNKLNEEWKKTVKNIKLQNIKDKISTTSDKINQLSKKLPNTSNLQEQPKLSTLLNQLKQLQQQQRQILQDND